MLRRLTLNDIQIFIDIRTEALHLHPESFGSPEEEQGGEIKVAAYRRWLSGELWGAFEDNTLIGTTGFYVQPGKRCQHRGSIFFVYVQSPYRGKGIGDQLIKNILVVAEQRVDQVHICVNITNGAAIKTYKRNGFEIYGTDPRIFRVNGVDYDEYLMVKKFR